MTPLLRAGHFLPAMLVTAIATALAVSTGRGVGAVAVAAAVGTGQLFVGWSNDYIDRDRDRVADRRDKPIAAGQIGAGVVRTAALVAVIACVPLSFLSGWRSALLHLSAVAVAFAYNARLKSMIASPLPYLYAFGCLPAVITLGLAGHPLPPWWATISAALLGLGAHFLNTLADIDDDLCAGVRGLPQRLGPNASLGIGVFLMSSASLLLVVAPSGRPSAAVLVLLAIAWMCAVGAVIAARRGHPRITWKFALGAAAIAVLLFLAEGRTLA